MQATNNSRTSSWEGLIESGLECGVQFGEMRNGKSADERQRWCDAFRTVLRNTAPGTWVTVAQEVTRVLDRPNRPWRNWLKNSVGSLEVTHPDVLIALKGLSNRFSPMILTTNYDDLLARALEVEPVTWSNINEARNIVAGRSPNILHIHGLWSEPETVVLGVQSYVDILNNDLAQVIQRAAAYLNTLIFIGCGDGVRDENVGGLLRWIEKTLASSSLDHYILMRTDVADTFAPIGGLVVVPYGSSYDDLPVYLESLKPTVEAKSLRADIAAKREQIKGFGSAWVDRNGRFRQEQPSPKSVAGDWTGFQTQQVGPMKEPISYRVGLQLSGDDDGLAGTFYFRFGPQGAPLVEESLAVAGRIDGGRFLRLAYQGGEPDKPQFGELLLELGADGDVLVGNDVGYGYTTRQILMAATRLRRSIAS